MLQVKYHATLFGCSGCIFPTPGLESAISSRRLDSIYWRMVVETKIWVLRVLIATGTLLILYPLS